jgi:hypothetical protein
MTAMDNSSKNAGTYPSPGWGGDPETESEALVAIILNTYKPTYLVEAIQFRVNNVTDVSGGKI